ncbi:MAG: hypothetical protein RLZZ297_234, partial [Chloroflexota bacterium]
KHTQRVQYLPLGLAQPFPGKGEDQRHPPLPYGDVRRVYLERVDTLRDECSNLATRQRPTHAGSNFNRQWNPRDQ